MVGTESDGKRKKALLQSMRPIVEEQDEREMLSVRHAEAERARTCMRTGDSSTQKYHKAEVS